MSGYRTRLGVTHAGPMVFLHFGRTRIDIRHADAAQLAQWIRLHSKEAKRKNRDEDVVVVGPSIFEQVRTQPEPEPYWAQVQLIEYGAAVAQTVARSTPVAVDHLDELVRMVFGNVGYGMHYADARPFSDAIRLHARAAKVSTGDDGVRKLTAGIMSDAEANYRRGV